MNTSEYKAQVGNDQGLIPANVNHGAYKAPCDGFSQCPFPCQHRVGDQDIHMPTKLVDRRESDQCLRNLELKCNKSSESTRDYY